MEKKLYGYIFLVDELVTYIMELEENLVKARYQLYSKGAIDPCDKQKYLLSGLRSSYCNCPEYESYTGYLYDGFNPVGRNSKHAENIVRICLGMDPKPLYDVLPF